MRPFSTDSVVNRHGDPAQLYVAYAETQTTTPCPPQAASSPYIGSPSAAAPAPQAARPPAPPHACIRPSASCRAPLFSLTVFVRCVTARIEDSPSGWLWCCQTHNTPPLSDVQYSEIRKQKEMPIKGIKEQGKRKVNQTFT